MAPVPPVLTGSESHAPCPEWSSAAFCDPGADLQAASLDGPKLGEGQEAWVGPGRDGLPASSTTGDCVLYQALSWRDNQGGLPERGSVVGLGACASLLSKGPGKARCPG